MKKFTFGVAAAAILAASAFAQAAAPAAPGGGGAATNAPAAAAAAAFTLVAADATKLKTWITDQKTASVAAPAGFTVAVGSVVPAAIMLRAIPATVGVTAVGMNQYAVIADKIVLVNPTDRKIVYVFA
jgi:hypothetical protein